MEFPIFLLLAGNVESQTREASLALSYPQSMTVHSRERASALSLVPHSLSSMLTRYGASPFSPGLWEPCLHLNPPGFYVPHLRHLLNNRAVGPVCMIWNSKCAPSRRTGPGRTAYSCPLYFNHARREYGTFPGAWALVTEVMTSILAVGPQLKTQTKWHEACLLLS